MHSGIKPVRVLLCFEIPALLVRKDSVLIDFHDILEVQPDAIELRTPHFGGGCEKLEGWNWVLALCDVSRIVLPAQMEGRGM